MNIAHPFGFLAVLAVLGVVVFLCAFGWAIIAADALRSGSSSPGGAPAPTSPGEANLSVPVVPPLAARPACATERGESRRANAAPREIAQTKEW